LGLEEKAVAALDRLDRIFNSWSSPLLILSHEVLGNHPLVVNFIAERALRRFSVDEVIAIGYTRIQSSYFQAAYRQWYFRCPTRLTNDIRFLHAQGLRPEMFTPLERRIIVEALSAESAVAQLPRNWFRFYELLTLKSLSVEGTYIVKSNHIPTRRLEYSLLSDFLVKVGIECDPELVSVLDQNTNPSFSPMLCEAMAISICNEEVDSSWIPGPHNRNDWLDALSARVKGAPFTAFSPTGMQELISLACFAIDKSYASTNRKYCTLMNVEWSYFDPEAEMKRALFTIPGSPEDLRNAFKSIANQRSPENMRAYEHQLIDFAASLRT